MCLCLSVILKEQKKTKHNFVRQQQWSELSSTTAIRRIRLPPGTNTLQKKKKKNLFTELRLFFVTNFHDSLL